MVEHLNDYLVFLLSDYIRWYSVCTVDISKDLLHLRLCCNIHAFICMCISITYKIHPGRDCDSREPLARACHVSLDLAHIARKTCPDYIYLNQSQQSTKHRMQRGCLCLQNSVRGNLFLGGKPHKRINLVSARWRETIHNRRNNGSLMKYRHFML